MKDYTIHQGDCRAVLHELPEASVQCVVTSPPYWGLRDYKLNGDGIGLEKALEEYIDAMVAVFQGVRRVLRDDGVVWLNMGDAYASAQGGRQAAIGELPKDGAMRRTERAAKQRNQVDVGGWSKSQHGASVIPSANTGLKPKDLIGLPWRVAFALQDDGWWLRADCIWHKPNPMPESVTDRPTKAHEYVFLLSKAARYFYDAEAVKMPTNVRSGWHRERERGVHRPIGQDSSRNDCGRLGYNSDGTNLRSVWTIPTEAFKEAHFATFPRKLVTPCIKAGTSDKGRCHKCGTPWGRVAEKKFDGGRDRKAVFGSTQTRTTGWEPGCACYGRWYSRRIQMEDYVRTVWHWRSGKHPPLAACVVLDPFCGSGTTGVVATQLGRRFVGIELNPDYCEMARKRIENPEPVAQIPDVEGQLMLAGIA